MAKPADRKEAFRKLPPMAREAFRYLQYAETKAGYKKEASSVQLLDAASILFSNGMDAAVAARVVQSAAETLWKDLCIEWGTPDELFELNEWDGRLRYFRAEKQNSVKAVMVVARTEMVSKTPAPRTTSEFEDTLKNGERDVPAPGRDPKTLIRLPEVIKMIGVSRPMVYRLIQRGYFPKPIKQGQTSSWPLGEVVAYLEQITDAR